ncbi:hypothetical protein BDP27DRAFT_1062217 [Rhodocollybia butyracea]|uniref:Uncharacterized protein n=1 Tax=Rhodocollybia butyracea TaxID=206335 RepID=A0A9P5P0D5_9AGAR|nr:hypothetical protein BDP27DRAFT_1062217 [Rhodocollybia butyracea]
MEKDLYTYHTPTNPNMTINANIDDNIVASAKYLAAQFTDSPSMQRTYQPTFMTLILGNEEWKALARDADLKGELWARVSKLDLVDIFQRVEGLENSKAPDTDSFSRVSISAVSLHEELLDPIQAIERFVDTLKEPMKNFVLSDQLPIWNPPESWAGMTANEIAEISEHIRSLAIPARSDNPDCPDMLLHDLGKLTNTGVSQLIETTFAPDKQPCLLINTSGSGKTRAMLEGLTRQWGFYFVCSDDEHGSRDLSYVIDHSLPENREFISIPSESFDEGRLRQNQQLAAQRFFEVLLSRLAVFDLFLDVLSGLAADLDSIDYRKMWLLLQTEP